MLFTLLFTTTIPFSRFTCSWVGYASLPVCLSVCMCYCLCVCLYVLLFVCMCYCSFPSIPIFLPPPSLSPSPLSCCCFSFTAKECHRVHISHGTRTHGGCLRMCACAQPCVAQLCTAMRRSAAVAVATTFCRRHRRCSCSGNSSSSNSSNHKLLLLLLLLLL